jgi:hypothetical protein
VDRTGDFARYHGQPRRVVSAGAQFAAACDYLGRRDVVEATKAEWNGEGVTAFTDGKGWLSLD